MSVTSRTGNYSTCRTQTTGPPIVVPVDPQISAVIFQGDCTTSVTSAVAAGDSLCLVIKIDDFSSKSEMHFFFFFFLSPNPSSEPHG